MFDEKRFRAAMILAGVSTADVAKALNIDESTLYRKIRADGNFTRKEISILVEVLKLDGPNDVFFAEKLA